MKTRVVSATEFKSKCLALLDEIDGQGGTIIITKRGRALATVGPVKKQAWKSPEGEWIGRVEIVDDIVGADKSDLWDSLQHG